MKHTEQRMRSPSGAMSRSAGPRGQRGGTIVGFIVGVVVGLVAALAVAVYVTKVPIPFMNGNKTQGRTAEHDAAESKKNQNWDPNAPLHGRSPARPMAPPTPSEGGFALPPSDVQPSAPAAAVLNPPVAPVARPAPSSDPLGDLAKARSAANPLPTVAPAGVTSTADPFDYFVQAGAFRTPEDAETQRARLAMLGLEARVTEREQAGRTVYRVRMGPYKDRDEAERTKERIAATGADTALVRVQR